MKQRRSHEKDLFQQGADHPSTEAAQGRDKDGGHLPPTRDLRQNLLPMESQIRDLPISGARCLKLLEIENAKLLRAPGQQILDIKAREVLFRRNLSPTTLRSAALPLRRILQVSNLGLDQSNNGMKSGGAFDRDETERAT